jgi:DNA-binding XRE family transcriptional regulator
MPDGIQDYMFRRVNGSLADRLQRRGRRRAIAVAAVLEPDRTGLFSIAAFAFVVSALAPRLVAAWTLEGDAVGVHPQTIGYIERRQYNLSLSLAFRLAGYFGLTLDAVFAKEPFEPLSDDALKGRAS